MRDVEDAVPYRLRTCDARPYGLYIRGDACRGGSRTARFKPVYARFMRDVEGAVPYQCGRAMHAPTKAFNLILYGMMIGHLYNSSNDVEFG